jgi:hypothetical protein
VIKQVNSGGESSNLFNTWKCLRQDHDTIYRQKATKQLAYDIWMLLQPN